MSDYRIHGATAKIGFDAQGLPAGLHLIGRPFDEQSVLNAGLALEERTGFTRRAEAWW